MKYNRFLFIALLIFAALITGCGTRTADLVLLNGRIVTVDEDVPEAEALAVRSGRILRAGTEEEINAYIGEKTDVIDLGGALAIPGLIESHGHFTSLGRAKMRLDLTKAEDWDDIVSMVAEAAAETEPGEWILGRGWHQEKWSRTPMPHVEGLPVHTSISRVSPDNPVLLGHASGHSCFANAKAMEMAGITRNTADPSGGEIVKDSRGNPIGVFRETAQRPLDRVLYETLKNRTPEEVEEERRKIVVLAVEECISKGITSFQDAGSSYETIELFKTLIDEGKLPVRLNVMISESNSVLDSTVADHMLVGYADHHLTVRSIKRLIDGALGAHGAWLLEPYLSLPSSTGLCTYPVEDLKETARIAIENGFQLCVHAIGDRGNHETLDVFEETFKSHPDKKDLRWRIEHAQHLHPTDIPRFGELGVIPSMQAVHCTSDGPWVYKRLGAKRAEEGAYVWQKLMDTGAVICNGTDVPVEDVDPIACYYAAVTRKMKDGNRFFPDQCMSREEALRSYTINGAYASFEEGLKGSLSPGKLADITVLSKDILTVPEDEIPDTEVLYTIIGGEIVYRN